MPPRGDATDFPMAAARIVLSFGVLLGLMTACDGSERGDERVFKNAGSVCFTSTPTGSVEVTVAFPGCLSSSCDHPKSAECRITERDGVINVASYGEVERDGGDCTDDCGSFTTRCASSPLAAGSYVVTYGDKTAELTLPTAAEQRFGDSAFPACQ